MQLTQLGVVITALALALAVLVWRGRIRRLNGENPEDRYRRDIHAVRRGRKIRAAERSSGDVWSAGAESPPPPQSRAKKATAWVTLGSTGGCGGCGGCGC